MHKKKVTISHNFKITLRRGITMTVAASWVRRVNNCEELIFISDSRICDGNHGDECPPNNDNATKRVRP